jgi:hypothetical protein
MVYTLINVRRFCRVYNLQPVNREPWPADTAICSRASVLARFVALPSWPRGLDMHRRMR